MAKRETMESKILRYFDESDLTVASLMLGLVQGRVKARLKGQAPAKVTVRRGRPPLREGEGGGTDAGKAIV